MMLDKAGVTWRRPWSNLVATSQRRSLLVALMALFSAPVQGATALIGSWAGDGFLFRADAEHATVQSGCSRGRSVGPVILDGSGGFAVQGYFNPPRSGYRLSDLAPRDRPAVFSGKVGKNGLDLVVAYADSQPIVHRLHKDEPIKFPRCP